MACVNPDGSITESAKALLAVIGNPLTPEEISKKLGQPLFKVRSSLREMTGADLVEQQDDKFVITEKGREKISV
jgi:predicted transcriptional regulator